MSQKDNFLGGFLLGTVLGGVVGGVLGAVVSSRLNNGEEAKGSEAFPKAKGKRKSLKAPSEQSIETARRGLEDKIAQLNDAIDDVRQQLGGVNGSVGDDSEEAIAGDR